MVSSPLFTYKKIISSAPVTIYISSASSGTRMNTLNSTSTLPPSGSGNTSINFPSPKNMLSNSATFPLVKSRSLTDT